MNEEFKFQGKSLTELKELSIKEFANMLPSRQRRSLTREFTDTQKNLLKKLEKKNNVKTHCRDMIIIPTMVTKTIKVYNGKSFEALRISEEMIGHFLGEYVFTRKKVSHNSPGVGATRSSASVSVR